MNSRPALPPKTPRSVQIYESCDRCTDRDDCRVALYSITKAVLTLSRFSSIEEATHVKRITNFEVPVSAESYELIIIGAGPGGIALAAEAQASGIAPARTLLLEKGPTHNAAIRQFYPEQKLTTANYKGFAARCEGLLCISDMNKAETIEFFGKIIEQYRLTLRYNSEVFAMKPIESASGVRFEVETSSGKYESRLLAIGIGILGRPNKPKEYPLPASLKEKTQFVDYANHAQISRRLSHD